MIDNYAWVAIFIRSITLVIAFFVIRRIWYLTKRRTRDQWIKYIFAFLIAVVTFNACFSLVINAFRESDGNLARDIRHMSLIFTSSSGLASIIGWYVLLRKDE